MRTIKFRGKSLFTGRWIIGDLYHYDLDGGMAIQFYDEEDGWVSENVKENTVGQFTGFKDKKGTEVFEGDILAVKACKGFVYKLVRYDSDDGMWIADKCNGNQISHLLAEFVGISEVIGNIHDNPELLKGGAQ